MKKYDYVFFIIVVFIIIGINLYAAMNYNHNRFKLQYIQNNEIITESFGNKEDFNKRGAELRKDSIYYYLLLE